MSFKTVIATGFHEAYFNALNTLARMPVQEGGPLDLSEFNRGMSELKGALLLNLTDIRGSKNALDLLFSPVKTEESAHNLFTNIVRFIPAAGETPRNAADRIDANPVYYNFLLAKALINSSEETQLHKSDELAPVRSFVLGALYALGDSLKQTQPEDTAEKIESILWNARYPAFGDDDEVFLATKAYFDSMTCYATSQFAPQCTVSENGLEGLKTFFSSRVRNVPSRTFARVSLPVKATDSAEPVTTVVELKGRSSDGSFNDEGFLMQKGEKGDPSKTKYKRSRVLGEGATGQVIEAFDTENHRDVAIKISLYSSIDTKLPPGSFDFERRIAASFSGEIVPEILDNGETPEGYPFTVMKILIGESLDKKILKGKLSIEGAYEVIGEVISLFSKVHARGVAHRDIKPENIF
ncbi:MAG: hypothetical protein IPJ69_09615 [Deltaproteobacteria bacterium]|nr:MAG: hypothetical protein IPJ69_09615 [Deltaproteobacteria bacterium]